ncbi:MAG: transglutaminase domain-containing protein [Proteobacteria bacterium]|nr:transglutaminase domain-containing protein [Pseudomonadota bacterium]
MAAPGAQAAALDGLPPDVGALAGVVQGLLIHEHVAPSYGVALSDAQRETVHLRRVEDMLAAIRSAAPAPLDRARPPAGRTAAVCRHFTLLHVAMLRHHGHVARARCGFATYFAPGKFVDHWVTEVRDTERQRWTLVDAQLDDHQRRLFGIAFDPLDVPRDRFVVAGDAWQACREGRADPAAFGIHTMAGLWFVASNVIRDVAALAGHEMLPWDVWGAMTADDAQLDLPYLDRLAGLSHAPEGRDAAIAAALADPRAAVPGTVFNAVRNRAEPAT